MDLLGLMGFYFFFPYVKMYFPGIRNENLQGKAMWVNTYQLEKGESESK